MAATIKTTISLHKALFDQSEALAEQLNISQGHLFEIAIGNFVKNQAGQTQLKTVTETTEDSLDPHDRSSAPMEVDGEQITVSQGDVFWVRSDNPGNTELGFHPHPYVVVQDNVFNHSRIHSVVVCALTSNLKQANAPGNVLLELGEANLPRQSAVVVSKASAVNKSQLGNYIGSLNKQRINQILVGMQFLQVSFHGK